MRIKSYFAGSVEQAIQEARQELGQEAMLITSRRSAAESRHLGAYEVVFGVTHSAAAASATARSKSKAPARPSTPPPAGELSAELQSLRAQLEDIQQTLQLGAGARQPAPAASEFEELCVELVSLDLAASVAREIAAAATALRERSPQAGRPLRDLATESITAKLRFGDSATREPLHAGSILAVTGPAGAGKTSTLVKIAVREVLTRRLPLRIVSVDPHRVGAQEKLRTLAGILGASFVATTTVAEFQEAMQETHRKHVTLIDTPAFDRAEPESVQEIAACLEKISRKELHLVLPASMKRADLISSVQQYTSFQPDYLLFTKLDETASYGALISTALETTKPVSFLATGQGIPEDIEYAGAEKLLANFLPRRAAEAVSAA